MGVMSQELWMKTYIYISHSITNLSPVNPILCFCYQFLSVEFVMLTIVDLSFGGF